MSLVDTIRNAFVPVRREGYPFIAAFAVVAWFLRWVRRHGFTPFAIYRIILGLVLFFVLARGFLGR